MALVASTRRFSFRGVHSLNNGVHREKCHGHRYFVEVSFHHCTVARIDEAVREKVTSVLDARELNQLLEPATGEVIVEWIHEQLNNGTLAGKILGVALQETRKNRFVSAHSDARLI